MKPYIKSSKPDLRTILSTGFERWAFIPTCMECCTGILLGSGKELEIAKQLFDTATLSDYLSDFELFSETYSTSAREESAFRLKSSGGNP